MSSTIRRRTRARSGMAMVEMVIITPLLLMMIFAIVEFGVMFGRWQTLTNAAREGARTAIVYRVPCDAATVTDEVRARVRDYAASLGITLTDAEITLTGACGGTDTTSVVNVTSPYSFRVLPGFASAVNPTLNLVGNSTMRNEG